MRNEDLENAPPATLGNLMNLDADESPWNPDELAAVLRHQLAALVEFDLTYLEKKREPSLDTLRSVEGPPITSFRDLFHHPRPPIELLRLTKEFAKASRSRAEAPLPEEIATLLYLLGIVAAMTRLGQRITKLDDRGLRHALRWALDQPWVDDETRTLLQEGLEAVDVEESD